jgi:hypothetical protein
MWFQEVDWLHLAQKSVQEHAPMKTVMNLRVP